MPVSGLVMLELKSETMRLDRRGSSIIAFNPAGSNFCNRGALSNAWYAATVLETRRVSAKG